MHEAWASELAHLPTAHCNPRKPPQLVLCDIAAAAASDTFCSLVCSCSCRESAGSRGGGSTAASAAGSSVEASLLSEEEYLLLTGRLHSVLRPFMMRRLKEAVAKELPGKVRLTAFTPRCARGGCYSAPRRVVASALAQQLCAICDLNISVHGVIRG